MNSYAAVILAAGQATRYRASGGREPTKLLAMVQGRPMVRHVVETALATGARPVIVVTGHASDAVLAALADLSFVAIHNAAFATGLAGSLQCGIAAVPDACPGAVVLLGDMPTVSPATLDALMTYALTRPDADATVPTHQGRRGNPVLLGRSLFPAVGRLAGDVGAKPLLQDASVCIATLEVPDPGILHDVDRPADLTGGAGPRA